MWLNDLFWGIRAHSVTQKVLIVGTGPYKDLFGVSQIIYFTKSWVPIGSLFQSLGVPISLGDSEIVDTQSIFHIVDNVDNFDFVDNLTLMSSLTLLKLYC